MSLLVFLIFGAMGGVLTSIYSLFSAKLPLVFLVLCDILFSFLTISLFALPFFIIFEGVFSLYQPLFFALGFAVFVYLKKFAKKVLTKIRK